MTGTNGTCGSSDVPDWECYKHVREEIAREWTQITSRIGWLVTSQAFLFAVLTVPGDTCTFEKNPLLPLVPLIGLGASLSIFWAVWAALRRIRILRAWQRGLLGSSAADTSSTSRGLAPSHWLIHWLGAFPTYVIPVSLFLGWIHVLGIANMARIAGWTFDPNQLAALNFHIAVDFVFALLWGMAVWEKTEKPPK